MDAAIFLPYHCPRLSNGNFLRPPCAGKVAEAEALRAKLPNALLGALEHCLNCQGKDLVVREAPPVEYTGDIRPEVTKEPVYVEEERGMAGVVTFKDDAEAERVLGPGKIPAAASAPLAATPEPGQFCKNCPGVESHRNKHGRYMGLCRECLAKSAAENSRNRGKKAAKGKMTPAVARDLGIVPAPQVKPPVCQNDPPAPENNVQASPVSSQNDPPLCNTHKLPIKFNRLGVSMGGCELCRREIAARGGQRAKILQALDPLERVFAGFTDELAWLRENAREQVRTPEGQLVFLVRQAMEQGT